MCARLNIFLSRFAPLGDNGDKCPCVFDVHHGVPASKVFLYGRHRRRSRLIVQI